MQGDRSTWAAVAWAEALVLVGVVLIAIAVGSSAHFCTSTLGCDQSSSGSGVGLVFGFLGVVAFLAAPFYATRRSGRQSAGLVAVLAVAGFLVALGVGAILFGALVDDVLPALVLALGVEGAIAVKPPSRRAIDARFAMLGGLVVLSGLLAAGNGSDGAILVIAVLTLPAVAVADALAGRRATGPGTDDSAS